MSVQMVNDHVYTVLVLQGVETLLQYGSGTTVTTRDEGVLMNDE